jgi:hypothetical protein
VAKSGRGSRSSLARSRDRRTRRRCKAAAARLPCRLSSGRARPTMDRRACTCAERRCRASPRRRIGSRARSVSLVRSGGPATRSCLPRPPGDTALYRSERGRWAVVRPGVNACSLLELQSAVDGGATGGECRAIHRWHGRMCVCVCPRRPRDMKMVTRAAPAHDLCTARITLR